MYGTYDACFWLTEVNVTGGGDPADLALEAAAADTSFVWVIPFSFLVIEFGVYVTVAFDYDTQTTEGVVALDRRPTPASDTGRVEVARVDLEDGLAIYSHRRAPRETTMATTAAAGDAGNQLIVEIVTQGAGGGSIAGDWQPYVLIAPRAEVAGNVTLLTESDVTQVAT